MNTGVLVRYFADDDPPRALAAARLIDGDDTLVVSTGVLIEVAHVLRTQHSRANPEIADALVAFLTKRGVELADADQAYAVAALRWSARVSARRIPDALIAAAADRADAVTAERTRARKEPPFGSEYDGIAYSFTEVR